MVHPSLRIVLPLVLIVSLWFIVRGLSENERGAVAHVLARVLGVPRDRVSPPREDLIAFYTTDDGTIDVIEGRRFIGYNDPRTLLAFVVFGEKQPNRYGIIFTPIVIRRPNLEVVWNIAEDEIQRIGIQGLEEALSPYRELHAQPSSTDTLQPLRDAGLLWSPVIRHNLPLRDDARRKFNIDVAHLFGELTLSTLLVWWLLALRYARRFWPKPDGSRCPSCGYELAGLASPVCPECGRALPAPAARV